MRGGAGLSGWMAVGVKGRASPAGRRGALRGGSWADGRSRGQAGQGVGAVCTMAYPGHPGAGGGYYPGGVSAVRAGTSASKGRVGAADTREEAERADSRSRMITARSPGP